MCRQVGLLGLFPCCKILWLPKVGAIALGELLLHNGSAPTKTTLCRLELPRQIHHFRFPTLTTHQRSKQNPLITSGAMCETPNPSLVRWNEEVQFTNRGYYNQKFETRFGWDQSYFRDCQKLNVTGILRLLLISIDFWWNLAMCGSHWENWHLRSENGVSYTHGLKHGNLLEEFTLQTHFT